MLKVLVPVDGSKNCLRAIEYLIGHADLYKEPLQIHLLNVQRPFPGTVRGVREQADKFHHDEGIKALAGARKLLDAASLDYEYHINVGETPEMICKFVKQKKIEEVVMCTRGMGAVANMLMGSVASKVLHLVEVPLVLVK
jgi:nucleotide-binding universal stress UspA family protein